MARNEISEIFMKYLLCAGICCAMLLHPSLTGRAQGDERPSLTELNIEELMDIEVTSVSKKPERLFNTASAVFVITSEAIRRSGVTSIPEALRMVPGVEVARINSNKWAISIRGFNSAYANKLLVMIDGRTVYSPVFAGVFWDVQDTLLEDLDRIEVIRGPGATMWGANAVNGVINIITKHAEDTQGGYVEAGVGTVEQGFGGVRYGARLGEDAFLRVYAKYFNRDNSVDVSGNNGEDGWHQFRSGFRLDWGISGRDSLTVQGDAYTGQSGLKTIFPTLQPPFAANIENTDKLSGANVLMNWRHTFMESSDVALKMYYDRTSNETTIFGVNVDTFDMDFQHRFKLLKGQEVIWGLGYRYIHSDAKDLFLISFNPPNRKLNLFSAFVQDDIVLVKDRLRLTAGAKLEHNDFTGWEIQPSGRLLWTPHERHALWASVSRAVRTSDLQNDSARINFLVMPGPPLTAISILPNRDLKSEELIACELGYRTQATERLSLDIAGFYNVYNNLVTQASSSPFFETSPLPPHLVIPLVRSNKMHGTTYGVELAADLRALDWWRLQAAYTFLQMHLRLDADSSDPLSKSAEGNSPHHQVSLRSSMDLPGNLGLDLWLRYVERLPALEIKSYVTLDVRLAWKPRKDIEVSVVGQNLLDNRHPEFKTEFDIISPTEVERNVYGKVTWHF